MPAFSQDDQATIRRLLDRYRRARGYSYEALARAATLSPGSGGHLHRLVRSPVWKGLSPHLAHRLHAVLGFGIVREGDDAYGVRAADRDAWLRATHLLELTDLQAAARTPSYTARNLELAAPNGTNHSARPQHVATAETRPSFQLELPLDLLTEMGVDLDCRDQAAEAVPVLHYLVNPCYPYGLLIRRLQRRRDLPTHLAAMVASGHLGHAQLNIDALDQGDVALRQALDLVHGCMAAAQHDLVKAWERWYVRTGRSVKDFELWCMGTMAAIQQKAAGTNGVAEAVGRYTYIAREARTGQLDARGIRANALRDRAVATVRISPAAPQAEADFDEAVSLLSDLDETTMLAITCLKRARWRKAAGDTPGMEDDVCAGLELPMEPQGVVRVNALTTAAEVYADLEPSVAGALAHRALERAVQAGYQGQCDRAEAVLSKLAHEKANS